MGKRLKGEKDMARINGEKLRKAVDESGINATKISKLVLNMGSGYLSDC